MSAKDGRRLVQALACDSEPQTHIPRLGDYCLAAVHIRKRSDAAAA